MKQTLILRSLIYFSYLSAAYGPVLQDRAPSVPELRRRVLQHRRPPRALLRHGADRRLGRRRLRVSQRH